MRPVYIVMGVAGAGKSTFGARLAAQLGAVFLEGDNYHDEASRQAMAAGRALNDAERLPWLDRIIKAVSERDDAAVISCSALRRSYRQRLRHGIGQPLTFIFLDIDEPELLMRLQNRTGHFAGPALLASQLAQLERPDEEPDVVALKKGEVWLPPELMP